MILLHTRDEDDALALGGANPNHLLHACPSGDDGAHNNHMPNVVVVTTESDDDDDDAIWIPPDEAAAADSMELEDDDDDDEPTCYDARAGGSTSYCTDEDDVSDDDDDATTSSSIRWCHADQSATNAALAADREKRQKAMLRAMNGQLRMLAARFLESAGIGIDTTSNSNSCCWFDIVTSLSWEAALVIKPDVGTAVGNQMDPSSYIKVKCLASGTPRQCEVVKGLVFRKNVAHKHMPTKCHNPRLLLLSGVLGHSHVGFSSFSSIEQEKEHLDKSVSKMMEICRPNVIMVEKTVSRDIQELLLKEGVTLVLDMKLSRLQRVALCSGAPILSFSEVLSKPKLKQCDYFHIEKVTEEHNLTCSTGVGKRPSKTLMFLEGFQKPLGCTILLRGANTEELKKIKQVMNYTVFAAYRLVLETSFFEDQRLILNNKNSSKEEVSVTRKAGPSPLGSVQESTDGVPVTISSTNFNALNPLEKNFPNELQEGSVIYYDSNQALPSEGLASAVPESPRRFIDIFHYHNIYLPVTASQEATDHQIEDRPQYNEGMASNGIHVSPNVGVPIGSGENVDHLRDPREQASSETNQQMTLDDTSVSEKHEQSLENIKHSTSYNNGDKTSDIDEVDDVLESQSILILLSSQCITKQVICEQSRLSRIRYYGNFDVSLGRYLQDILQKQNLSCSSCGEPPEAHMYSYTHRNGNLTVLVKRLLPKYRLPGESEGKIWMWTRCLRCEHENGISRSSRRVIMSTEAHYLSFGKFLELSFSSHSTARRLSICGHSLNRDCLRFFGLGSKVAMFQYSSVEIYNACKPQPTLEFHNPNMHDWYGQEVRNVLATGVTLFSEVTGVLQKLKDQFPELAIYCGAFFPVKDFSQLEEMLIKEKAEFMDSLEKAVDRNRESSSVDDILNVNWLYQDLLLELYVWDHRLHQLLDCTSAENAIVGNGIAETSEFTGDQTAVVAQAGGIGERMSSKASFENRCIEPEKFSEPGTYRHASTLLDDAWNKHYNDQHSTKVPSSGTSNCLGVQSNIPQRCDGEKWVWNPLNESRLAYRQEVKAGCLERFQVVNHYCPTHLAPLHKHRQSAEEISSPQFTVGPGGSILCVSEDEISSIISRALAISEERRHLLMDAIAETETADIRGREYSKTIEKSYSSVSESSFASLSWSLSFGSSDSEASISSDDLSSYDSSLLSSSLHPEISVNGRIALKGKYSVICVHSNQFYNLRKKCCPSELAYITSLSRCKKWDAQGGKSKAFFAKTMDDRLIIKQIKKTEFESFIKFAPDYFKHVNHSLDTGSQTCLAKILGIYQVKQIRHGKEIKMDLMVMENILFGHNVSRTYDLKGAIFSRYVSDSNDHGTVYLDQNFVDDMRVSPIYIGGRAKHLLERAIWNDTSFLTSINVMDYSLLVGVDRQKHELVFGIIDYLRQYTWDKQLETMVKASLVVPRNESPTVISPRDYKKRFRKFMSKHFLTVPDDWSTENLPSVACESCAHAGNTTKLPGLIDEKPQHPSPILACA